jgi:hypothetical protein
MTTKPNHRRGEPRTQDNGPTYESPTPSAGCNSTHVARSRSKWKRRASRSERRTGTTSPKCRLKKLERPSDEVEVVVKNCTTCIHRMGPGQGCSQPDLYDLDNEDNLSQGTSADAGFVIQQWRDSAHGYFELDVVEHDEPCPGWEVDDEVQA